MELKTSIYDPADFLIDDETIVCYLTDAPETYDARILAKALGAVACARGGISQLAVNTGISRKALDIAFSDTGNTALGTVLKIMHALGMRLSPTLVA